MGCAARSAQGNSQGLFWPDPKRGQKRRGGSIAKWRKIVSAVGTKRQRLGPHDSDQIKRTVEVRKQRAAARGLPFEPVSELGDIDTDKDQVALAGKMLCRSFPDLVSRREMNEAIAQVCLRALEFSGALGLKPQRNRTNFIDQACHRRRLCSWMPNDYQAETFPA